MAKEYSVYIMASHTRVLYTGVTNSLLARVYQHKTATKGFTAKYGVNRLAYFESGTDVTAAIAREKEIKSWTRAKKIALIKSTNPTWRDLSFGWYDDLPSG